MKKTGEPHWIKHTHLFGPDEYVCSSCGATYRRRSKSCPNCGAILRAVSEKQEWLDEAVMLNEMLGDK